MRKESSQLLPSLNCISRHIQLLQVRALSATSVTIANSKHFVTSNSNLATEKKITLLCTLKNVHQISWNSLSREGRCVGVESSKRRS